VGALVGVHRVVARLNALGLELHQPAGYYGNALALGSADVTLLALTNAYRALANGGAYAPVAWRAGAPAPVPLADPGAVYVVTDILADNEARARTFGLDSVLSTRGFAAVKTGTSKDMRDNWCIGYSDAYTVGVWVGNANGEPMHGVSGVSGAAPVWHALMAYLHRTRVSRPPAPPAGVVRVPVQFDGALEPARVEAFLAGTQQTTVRAGHRVDGAQQLGIVAPRDGSLFALDPDIPARAQRLTFEGERGVWRLDGRSLGQGARLQWSPWPGRHELTWTACAGGARQTVHFEVRGASVRAGRAPPAGAP
jgi:penicillin-binding protein 1C